MSIGKAEEVLYIDAIKNLLISPQNDRKPGLIPKLRIIRPEQSYPEQLAGNAEGKRLGFSETEAQFLSGMAF